jgi:cytochrome c553
MKKLITRSRLAAAIAIACTVVGTAGAAEISLPPDPGARDAHTLVSFACSKCHGPFANGISISPLFPILAAQNSVYLDTQLKLLRQHGRADPHARAFMWGISHALTDEQIQGLALYFSSQPAVGGQPSNNPALAAKGKEIYENGRPGPNKVIRCVECHGDNSAGTNSVPRLAGQHPDYLALQLHYYRDGLRTNKLMNRNVKYITDDEIAAVVEYIGTLSGATSPSDLTAPPADSSQ